MVYLDDQNGVVGQIGSYDIGRPFPVMLVFDMDTWTYDVWLDGMRVVDDRAHGITDSGVGQVLFGCLHDPDLNGVFNVDNILVTGTPPM